MNCNRCGCYITDNSPANRCDCGTSDNRRCCCGHFLDPDGAATCDECGRVACAECLMVHPETEERQCDNCRADMIERERRVWAMGRTEQQIDRRKRFVKGAV